MQEQNNRRQSSNENEGKEFANKNYGPRGVDKAPDEETSLDIENVVAQTQKGKNKVDGDPEKESDQPIENE